MRCPKCKREMKSYGNISGTIYCSYPAQWDEVFGCENCEIKTTVRMRGTLPPDYSHVNKWNEAKEEKEL